MSENGNHGNQDDNGNHPHRRSWLAPLLVVALLLLPFLYVGSYFAMVTPGHIAAVPSGPMSLNSTPTLSPITNYRFGEKWAERIYWPLEQVDRKLFPERWEVRAWWDDYRGVMEVE